jgi:hypothetical protein
MNQDQIPNEDIQEDQYVVPVENAANTNIGGIALPNNPQIWLFVMIVVGISTIFGVLTTLQNTRTADAKEAATEWKVLYKAAQRRGDSLQNKLIIANDNCVETVNRLRAGLAKIDSITNSPNNGKKYQKLNNEIKKSFVK